MKIYGREVTPAEKAKREKRKKTAELWLVKIPLILWVIVSVVCAACYDSDLDVITRFLVVLVMLGFAVLPVVRLLKFAIWVWDN